VIESLTADGRDRSLDYKITGFKVPKGSCDARVVDALAPAGDEIIFPKTCSSVFISTNIDYVLRNLGTRYLIIAGCLTDQCFDSTVRGACDLGYLVTVPTDAFQGFIAEPLPAIGSGGHSQNHSPGLYQDSLWSENSAVSASSGRRRPARKSSIHRSTSGVRNRVERWAISSRANQCVVTIGGSSGRCAS